MGEFKSGCGAVIAVKHRTRGKSHLAGDLSPASRITLIRAMLDRVVRAAEAAHSLAFTVVVSPERDTVPARVPVLHDEGIGLNEALTAARERLRATGIRHLLVLPGDLASIDAQDIDALVDAGRRTGVALAPDAAGLGTNGLVSDIDLPFIYQFGTDSRRRHVAEARRLDIEPLVVMRPGLEFDVDSPPDLRRLGGLPWACEATG